MSDPSTSSGLAAEFYRDKLVDWMISCDIPTGSGDQSFERLLELVGMHITALRKERDNYGE